MFTRVSIQWSDAGGVWLPILPDARIRAYGEWVDYSGERFDRAVSDLREMMAAGWRPPLTQQHSEYGGALGTLQEIRVVTREDAERRGIVMSSPRVLMGRFFGPGLHSDVEGIAHTSPSFSSGEDDSGAARSFILRELSLVTVPHLKTTLPAAGAMALLQWADARPGGHMAEHEAVQAEDGDVAGALASIQESLTALMARVEALEAAEPMADSEEDEAMSDKEKDGEYSDASSKVRSLSDQLSRERKAGEALAARLATLERREKERDADDAVRQFADRLPADKVKRLRDLHLRDREAFDLAVEAIPELPAVSEGRSARGGAGAKSFADLSPADRHRQMADLAQRESITMSEARARLMAGGAA